MDALVLPTLSVTLKTVSPDTIVPDPLITTWATMPVSPAAALLLQSWPLWPLPLVVVPSGMQDTLYLIHGYPIWRAATEIGIDAVVTLVLSDTPLPPAIRSLLHGFPIADLNPAHNYYTLTIIRQHAMQAGLVEGGPLGWTDPQWRETGIDAGRSNEERSALAPRPITHWRHTRSIDQTERSDLISQLSQLLSDRQIRAARGWAVQDTYDTGQPFGAAVIAVDDAINTQQRTIPAPVVDPPDVPVVDPPDVPVVDPPDVPVVDPPDVIDSVSTIEVSSAGAAQQPIMDDMTPTSTPAIETPHCPTCHCAMA